MHELTEEQEAAVRAFLTHYLSNIWVAVAANTTGYTEMLAKDHCFFEGVTNEEMIDDVQAYMQVLEVESITFKVKAA